MMKYANRNHQKERQVLRVILTGESHWLLIHFSLSDNIAGVTLLAFGNGAPDIFSSMAGVSQKRPGKTSLP